ncbi:hypothetical protein QYE76_026471 [Lolium multiflorum]|uniref:Uncharacterized protein n=1 Tax=Lolium multiflorum TaxID=4521 RepID=A0AAD8RJQ2_LOLMU|nr:hypothetical protein QYE76_026471 [Lolium multiflorum]
MFLPFQHLHLKKNSRGSHGTVTQHEGMFAHRKTRSRCIVGLWWNYIASFVLMYLILTMPVILFLGADSPSMLSNESDGWVSFTKFLTGASVVGSIAIPSILKHAGIIGWGALTMELSSFGVFGLAILWYIHLNREDEYSSVF